MQALKSWLAFDIFGVAPSLSFKGGGRTKSTTGILFSYIMLLWIALSATYSFSDMVLKKNPKTVTSVLEGRQTGVPFGKKDFAIGFSFFDPVSGTFMNDREIASSTFLRYDLPVTDDQGNIINPAVFTKLRTMNCTNEHFTSKFLSQGECLALDEGFGMSTLISESVLLYKLTGCVNSTSQNFTCKPQEVIDAAFKKYLLALVFPTNFINPSDYDEPFKVKTNIESVRGASSFTKNVKIVLQEYEVMTDDGIVFADVSSKVKLGVENLIIDTSEGTKNTFQVFVYLKGDKVVTRRNYPKIQESLAGTIALVRVGILLAAFFIATCTKISYYEELIQFSYKLTGSNGQSPKSPKFDLAEKSRKPRYSQVIEISQLQLNRHSSLASNHQDQVIPKIKSKFAAEEIQEKGINFDTQASERPMIPDKDPDIIKASQKISPQLEAIKKQAVEEDDNSHSLSQELNFQSKNDEPSGEVGIGGIEEKDIEIDLKQNQSQKEDIEQRNKSLLDLNKFKEEEATEQKQLRQIEFGESMFKKWVRQKFPCFFNTKKETKLKIGTKKIQREFCATRLLSRMRDVDRLKLLLLNDDQRVLFDNLPKPGIYDPPESENMMETVKRSDPKNRLAIIGTYYENILKKPNKTDLDCKLLDWVEYGRYQYADIPIAQIGEGRQSIGVEKPSLREE